jgi:DNA-binding transcriptional regulator GbsR (MarR family)
MKQLGVQFSSKQHLQIDDVVSLTGLSKAKVSRAAMQIGLSAIRNHGEGDEQSGFSVSELVVINELKSLN